MTACSKEIDKIVVPINHTTDNLHTTTENMDMPDIEVIPDTELRFKESKIVLEKKF
jgi:predicted ATP-dependent Lon-type protease